MPGYSVAGLLINLGRFWHSRREIFTRNIFSGWVDTHAVWGIRSLQLRGTASVKDFPSVWGKVMVQGPAPCAEGIFHMKRSIPQNGGHQDGEIFQQGKKGHWHCRILEFSGYPFAIVTPRGRIEWATTSAHKLLQRHWPADIGVKNRLPSHIHQWMTTCRRRRGSKDKPPTAFTPLTINLPSACITVRHMHDGVFSALLFEETLSEWPSDRLVSYGLTPRETEVLRWLVPGKSSSEIATILHVSARTVSKHLERIYLRLGVENRYAAIAVVQEQWRRNTLDQ